MDKMINYVYDFYSTEAAVMQLVFYKSLVKFIICILVFLFTTKPAMTTFHIIKLTVDFIEEFGTNGTFQKQMKIFKTLLVD